MVDRLGWCYPCQKTQMRRHYEENKDKYADRARRRKDALMAVVERLKDRPCADCGVRHPPWVMDFDHLDSSKKLGSPSRLARDFGNEDVVRAEAEKCDVVCSNCHRHRTHLRAMGAPLGTLQNRSAGDASVVGGA
jgi:hypothetical protein